ncbi:MAG: hypothetical protein WC641_05780 [Patescibacteria group bacterium]
MRRNASILLSILIGALVVGLGMGFFLKKANDDRTKLAGQAEEAKKTSEQIQATSLKAVAEARGKLDQANAEVEKARTTLQKIEAERKLMAAAEVLTPSKNLKGWQEAISLAMGVSLKFPPRTEIEQNLAGALTVIYSSASSSTVPVRWFSLTPYEQRLENELISTLYSTSTAVFLVKGHVLYGVRGYATGSREETYVLRILKNGEPANLVWLRGSGKAGQTQPLQVLSTLDFQ